MFVHLMPLIDTMHPHSPQDTLFSERTSKCLSNIFTTYRSSRQECLAKTDTEIRNVVPMTTNGTKGITVEIGQTLSVKVTREIKSVLSMVVPTHLHRFISLCYFPFSIYEWEISLLFFFGRVKGVFNCVIGLSFYLVVVQSGCLIFVVFDRD